MADLDPSEYNQASFVGGMNLLSDDTRLQPNQYRIGFNMTNRHDELEGTLQSVEDTAIPQGVIQELVTFGNFLVLFVSGSAYYRFYTDTGWKQIEGFRMSTTAPRYWTVAIPVSTTNYVRYAATVTDLTDNTTSSPSGVGQTSNVAGASAGNLPGLLVQDNISQPQFIFISDTGVPTVRVTQTFAQWSITFTDAHNVTVVPDGDKREYVPIGNSMAWEDGTLYVTSQDFNFIYRSVTGRPLDFVVNVTNLLAADSPYTQLGGGDATTTSYSVGVGGITCLRPSSSGGIFVSASNANFLVTKNKTPNAPIEFNEYTFIRTFLFNANCLSDRAIFDTVGDTRFVDITGVRSFNAVLQTQNEGRNTVFTSTIQAAFTGLSQDPTLVAGILYDNYELYAMQTIFGPAIAKYDTVTNSWSSFDITQTRGKLIKILSKIELAIQRLYAVTEDNRLYNLYIGPSQETGVVRTVGICATTLYANQNIKMNNPKLEIQPRNFRCVMNNITANCTVTLNLYANNRWVNGSQSKNIQYINPTYAHSTKYDLPDVNTLLQNLLFPLNNCLQGWKVFAILSWTGGTVTQYSMELQNVTPMNPLLSQTQPAQ